MPFFFFSPLTILMITRSESDDGTNTFSSQKIRHKFANQPNEPDGSTNEQATHL